MIESFNPLLLIGVMGAMLLIGVLCRAYIPLFRKYLVPASMIGGLLGFVVVSFGWFGLKPEMFKLFSFHLFNASFIALGLTGGGENSKGSSGGKTVLRGALWLGLATGALLCLQGIIGGGTAALVNWVTGSENYDGLGMLVAHGFVQGPGQALAIGGAWESNFNIPDAQTIALTFSAIGFLIAFFIGVPLANWGVKNGHTAFPVKALEKDFMTGIKLKTSNDYIGRETVHSANLDSFSLHLALIALVYMLNYGVCWLLQLAFAGTPLAGLTYGFFFVWGLFTAMIVRKIINVAGFGHLIDDAQMKHFTGIFVDFLMVATMMAISIGIVMKYIVLIASVIVVCTIFTMVYTLYLGRRIGQFDLERMLVLFGSGTGTIPSGLVLLRIADPAFKTTVALESGVCQLILVFAITHIIMIAGILPGSFTIIQGMGIWAATSAVLLVMLKIFKVWKKEKSF